MERYSRFNKSLTCTVCGEPFKGFHSQKYCDACGGIMSGIQRFKNIRRSKISSLVAKAVREKRLKKASVCELCGKRHSKICGHHYNGYGNPLDVWWICAYCNGQLRGNKWHNGTASKDDARRYLRIETENG